MNLGIDWKDVGINAFSGAHYGGKILASSFGGGALVAPVENLQNRGGLLKDWARSDGGTSTPPQITVSNPEAFVLVRANGTIEQPVSGAASVVITGGKRLEGDGRFSFGYDGVQRIDITTKSGQQASGTDVKTILFKGGTEAQTSVKGDDMSDLEILGQQIIGELEAVGAGGPSEFGGEYVVNEAEEPVQIDKNVYINGTDVLGAATRPHSRAGFVVRKTPRGREFTALAVAPRRGDFRASARNASDVGRRAIDVANRIERVLARLPTSVKGATPARQAKRLLTVAQLKKLAADVRAGGNKLLANGNKLEKTTGLAEAKEAAAKAALKAKMFAKFKKQAKRTLATSLRKPSGALATAAVAAPRTAGMRQTMLGASEFEILGTRGDRSELYDVGDDYQIGIDEINAVLGADLVEILGEDIIGARTWADGTPMTPEEEAQAAAEDAAFGNTSAPSAPSGTATAPAPAGEASYSTPAPSAPLPGPESNYGVPPFSAQKVNYQEDLNYQKGTDPATDRVIYNSTTMPLAGIIYYQNERGLPRDGFGSFERYYGESKRQFPAHGGNGYYWAGPETPVDGQGWARRYLNESGAYHDFGVPDTYLFANLHGAPYDALSGIPGSQRLSDVPDWGPLVGSPNGWTKGLHFDEGTKQWFWFWDQAPDWATGKVVRMAQLVQQAKLDYDAAVEAAKTAYLSQVAQDKLDEEQARRLAREQAEHDAVFSKTQATADQQAAIAEQQLAQQYAALDARQAEADQRMYEQQMQMEQRYAEQDVQERGMMLDYFKQNPQAMFEQGGGYGEDGVDWGDGGGAEGGLITEDQVDWGDTGDAVQTAEELFVEATE